MVKLFNDFDRLKKRAFSRSRRSRDDEKELLPPLRDPTGEDDFFEASFQLVLTFVQMPHVDLVAEMEKRKGAPLTDARAEAPRRARAVGALLARELRARRGADASRRRCRPAPRSSAQAQRGFLHRLAAAVKDAEWKDDALQAKVFDTARRTPIAQAAGLPGDLPGVPRQAAGPARGRADGGAAARLRAEAAAASCPVRRGGVLARRPAETAGRSAREAALAKEKDRRSPGC